MSTGGYSFDKELPSDPYMDYYLEIKIIQTAGTDDYGHGIFLKDERISGDYKENYFMISSNGFFKVCTYSEKEDSITDFQAWKESNLIKQGFDQANILAIKKSGSNTFFYINGEKVFEKQFSFWGSSVGFTLYHDQTVKIDHLLIKQDRGKIRLAEGNDADIVKENLGANINTKYSEIMPVISPDGQTLYIDVKDDLANLGSAEKEKDDVWFATRNSDGTWSKRKNMGPPVNNISHNFVISVTPDNNTLILASQYTSKGEWKANGLSMSHRTKKGWGMPEDITIEDFYNDADYTSYCISPDRKVMILAIERKDGYGYIDLHVSFKKKSGSWTAPKNMGKILNSYGYEIAPFIAADGKTLYYSTDGKLGYGSNDIFMSRRQDDSWTNWSEPQNLGPKVNTTDWDAYYTIPASGDYAYMVSSDHSLGEEDIFRVRVAHTAKPEPVVIIYGKVLDKNTKEPLQADIVYHELSTNVEAGTARSNPADGSYKIILPYGKAYEFLAEKKNYLAESDHIDLTEIKGYIEIERNLYLTPIQIGKSITLNNVFFVRSKPELISGSNAELDRLVKIMNDNPNLKIEISGHTDNQGPPEKNLTLSNDRVETIKKYLVDRGINIKRLSGKGYGETKPIASNATEETRKLNRRVEFTIVAK